MLGNYNISTVPLTVPLLRQHYGAKWEEERPLCGMPRNAALRQPAHWDCIVNRRRKVEWGPVSMDFVRYRALSIGEVISGCKKAAATELWGLCSQLKATFSAALPLRPSSVLDCIGCQRSPWERSSSRSQARASIGLRLDYTDATCHTSLYTEVEAAAILWRIVPPSNVSAWGSLPSPGYCSNLPNLREIEVASE